MGSNQILLIVLGVIIVGVIIFATLQLVDNKFSDQIKDTALKQMHEISYQASSHWKKPRDFGGGGISYIDFEIPNTIIEENLSWEFELRGSEDELNIFMISKDIAHNGQPYLLQGVHKNGKLVLIKLFNPMDNNWVTLFEEVEKSKSKKQGLSAPSGGIKKENLMKNKGIQ